LDESFEHDVSDFAIISLLLDSYNIWKFEAFTLFIGSS